MKNNSYNSIDVLIIGMATIVIVPLAVIFSPIWVPAYVVGRWIVNYEKKHEGD